MTETRHVELDPATDDNADTRACLAVWRALRRDRKFPAWKDFDWFAYPVLVIPYLAVADVVDDGADFRYRFWGTAHTAIFHQDYTHALVSDVQPAEIAQGLMRQYERVIAAGAPCLFMFEVLGGPNNDLPVRETSLRMPYSGDGEAVTQIVSLSDNRRQANEFAEFYAASREPG